MENPYPKVHEEDPALLQKAHSRPGIQCVFEGLERAGGLRDEGSMYEEPHFYQDCTAQNQASVCHNPWFLNVPEGECKYELDETSHTKTEIPVVS